MRLMRSPTHAPSARPAILAAARRLFSTRGFAETSVREIAAAAGVSKAAIYHHFRDKNRLYRELLDEGVTTLTTAMRRVLDDGPAAVQLARIVLLHLEFARAHADLLRLVIREQWRGERRGVGAVITRHHEEEVTIIATVLRRGLAAGEFKPVDPDLSAQALCAVVDILSAGYLMAHPPVAAIEVAQNAMDVLLNGLAAAPVTAGEIARLFNA